MSHDPRATWALEREIVLSRVIAAPRGLPNVLELSIEHSVIPWCQQHGVAADRVDLVGDQPAPQVGPEQRDLHPVVERAELAALDGSRLQWNRVGDDELI